MSTNQWSQIESELRRRRDHLVNLSHDQSFSMDPFERARIQSLLEKWEAPLRPLDEATLLKQFCVSSFSYAPLRNFLERLIGQLPTRANISAGLSMAYKETRIQDESVWTFHELRNVVESIQAKRQFDLSRIEFLPRMIAVLLTGIPMLETELASGFDAFYDRISRVTSPTDMWNLVVMYSDRIDNVGPALMCDFLKEIGFTRYVKVDHHFKKQLPLILASRSSCRLNPKASFVLSQEIADNVGITPFHMDSIMYLWGRYCS